MKKDPSFHSIQTLDPEYRSAKSRTSKRNHNNNENVEIGFHNNDTVTTALTNKNYGGGSSNIKKTKTG